MTPEKSDDAFGYLFFRNFVFIVVLGVVLVVGGHIALAWSNLLPEPPFTGTRCINEKFPVLRDAPLGDRTMLAVGSSATWRNLDNATLERRLAGARPYNAATCYLQINQTAFLTEFLLPRMPRVDTVLVVVAPRDFESCASSQAAFFDPALTDAYLAGSVPAWLPYVSGFRARYLAREVAARLSRAPPTPEQTAHYDELGSSILTQRQAWLPPFSIDVTCYASLSRLEAIVARHGARLVVATLPVMAAWRAAEDPDDTNVERWMQDMRSSLQRADSLLIDGRRLDWDEGDFADPVHVLYPAHRKLTRFYADIMARPWQNQRRIGSPSASIAR